MLRAFYLLALSGLALLGTPAAASSHSGALPASPEIRVEPWTVDDLLLSEEVSEMHLSRAGDLALWVKTSWQEVSGDDGEKGPKKVGHIFMARLGDKDSAAEPVQLTRGADLPSGLALSPDERHLAFLSSREQTGAPGLAGLPSLKSAGDLKGSQVWVLPLEGGEAYPLTRFKTPVLAMAWRDDARLLISRAEDPDARARHIKKLKDTSTAVEDPRDAAPIRLFEVDLEGRSKRLTRDDDRIEQVAVSADGQRAAITASTSLSYAFDAKVRPKTFLVDLASGERQEILENVPVASLRWTKEGLFYTALESDHPIYLNATVNRLFRYDPETGSSTPYGASWSRGLAGVGGVHPAERGVFSLMADGPRFLPALLRPDSEPAVLGGEHGLHIDRLTVSADGSRALYLHSTGDRPTQLFVTEISGTGSALQLSSARRLGRLNPSFENRPSGRTEIVTWTGAEGDDVDGVLLYPYRYEEGTRYPLILQIHGGPTGYDRDSWSASWSRPIPLWRDRGAFVLRVNYHGSGNYGLDWAASIRERYYELEIPDIESGVDMLIEKGLVDPDRLATSGWSNGGILSAKLITVTDRYRAAIIGAADVEWISDWANVDFGASFDNYYFGGPPWERLDHYIEKSPFFRLPEVTTPSLVHTGTEDRNVPPHQSWSIFRVMQQVGKADVRLLLYPGELHGLRQLVHQRRKVEEDLAWFDRYLFETRVEPDFTVPEGSPLAALLETSKADRTADGYGSRDGEALIPEVLSFGAGAGEDLWVGRFEVTRLQWRSYLEATTASPVSGDLGDADLPIAGVSFEQARDYARWLAEKTGQAWRLPTLKEAKALAGRGSGAGNTLTAWLGGAEPNPDDLESIERRLGDPARLLKAVGSSDSATAPGDPQGPRFFDLGGNVAEWATGGDGKAEAIGGSAERPAGSKQPPDPRMIGLRVVREGR
ncbi:MAG: prolyl oligopeptidase family serine peptidase [Acidobacteriota bacterium]